MNRQGVDSTRDFDSRLGDWLEEGAQSVPDWLVDAALEQAHATPQLGRGIRLPWLDLGRPLLRDLGKLAPALAWAVGALAVVTAFVLGLMSGPFVGDEPSPTPTRTPGESPASLSPGPVGGVQVIDVLPNEVPAFYALIGLTATPDAVWTVVATDTSPGRLVRIDAVSGQARVITIPDASGLLSPPAADGDFVWTASAAGLHRVDATGEGEPVTIPLDFQPAEIAASAEGLWVAREGGTNLVDRQSGQILREIEAEGQTSTGRIIGGPLFGSLWSCPDLETAALLDPADGAVRATVDLPPGSSCHGSFVGVSGVEGLGDGVIPLLANAVLHPSTGEVAAEFDLAWSDVTEVRGRPWFLLILRDPPGNLALVELDPTTMEPGSSHTLAGDVHLTTSFESGHLAVAGDYVWILGAPPARGDEQRPQIMRVPLAQLGGS